ncbi:MAG: transporter, partial [Bacteroidota bacterium]|nr:transporter [Bacteroidota bacterium]
AKVNNDTGFGNNAADYGGRFVNRDGSFNLRKEGVPVWERYSIYHSMLNMPRWKFISVIVIFFLCINLLYTLIYLLIGMDQFTGMIGNSAWQKIKEVYFFSTETFTTVGYGRVNPVGDAANFVASIEAMSGFLSFAVATGLIYGRFSKPKSYLIFSEHALIAPYQGKTGLMFRFVSYKDSHVLTDVHIRVSLGLLVEENGRKGYQFFDLTLERSRVDSLPMNWTVVHPIDEQSPFAGFSAADMKASDVELYVLVRGFDDVYSTMVQQRTSYTFDEILFQRKFRPMYRESDDGKTTIVELHKLNEHAAVNPS